MKVTIRFDGKQCEVVVNDGQHYYHMIGKKLTYMKRGRELEPMISEFQETAEVFLNSEVRVDESVEHDVDLDS